jgi:hypothetical protein
MKKKVVLKAKCIHLDIESIVALAKLSRMSVISESAVVRQLIRAEIGKTKNDQNKPKPKKEILVTSGFGNFAGVAEKFVEYRRAIKKEFKNQAQLDAWMSKLFDISDGSVDVARRIVDNSVANGWQGIFPDPANAKNAKDVDLAVRAPTGKYDEIMRRGGQKC